MNIKNHLISSTTIADYDVIAVTESWLNSCHHNNEFISDKYKVFRKDRDQSSIDADRGGGVLIAVRNEIDCEEFELAEATDLESVCVKFPLRRGNLYIYCAYIRPPSADNEFSKFSELCGSHVEAIKNLNTELKTEDILIVMGDFNLPGVRWIENADGFDYIPILGESNSRMTLTASFVTESLTDLGLSQMCNLANHSGNVLDLVYTNAPELVVSELAIRRLIPSDLSDKAHNPITLALECEPSSFNVDIDPEAQYCFKRANFQLISEHLNTIDWGSVLSTDTVDNMMDIFYELIRNTFDKFVPRAIVRSSKNPVWFTKKLCNLKNIRNREYKKYCEAKKENDAADISKFRGANDSLESESKIAFDDHIKKIASNAKSNPKQLWKFINDKRSSNTLPCKMTFNDKTVTTNADKAALFSEFFASVFRERPINNQIIQSLDSRIEQNCFNLVITPGCIFAALESLDTGKGQGPDKIPPLFLRECSESLALPLNLIFNKSLMDKKYPDCFKLGQVIPIFKAGAKSNIANYRGVTIMPNIAKVFERVVHNQLKLMITPHITNQQHGFLSNRSIESNLHDYISYIHEAFECNDQVDVFYADVKKAFDTVNQPLMISKLSKFPIGNDTLKWINNYSLNRKQFVRVGSDSSGQYSAHSAIGQGTICGPLLFLAFFNDSDDCIKTARSFNFADDKKIALKIRSMEDTFKLQSDIDNFVQWCKENDLELNVEKCKIMTFTHKKKSPIRATYMINGAPIDRVNEIRDLGVLLDSKLSFTSHMEYVKKKADNMLAFVKRVSYKSLNIETSKLLYGSLVRSNLEFASSVWLPHHQSHMNLIESTQKQAVIFLHKDNINRGENGYVLAPYEDRCKELELDSIRRRHLNASVLFMHKIITGRLNCPNLRSQLNLNTGLRTFRNPEFIKINFSRTDHGQSSPLNLACRAFNFAALFIDPTLPFDQFKAKLLKLPDKAFGQLA